jgi:puromycin-sensitive aminopeptidase
MPLPLPLSASRRAVRSGRAHPVPRALAAAIVMLAAAVMPAAYAQRAAGGPSSGHALSRLDAAVGQLPKSVLPLKVSAHIDVDPYRDDFNGSARYELRVRQPVRTIVLHARDLAVADARLAGVRQAPTVDIDAKQQIVTLRFARPVPAGRHELALRFSGRLNERGEGLYRVAATGDAKRKIVASEMEPVGARLMLPCFDEPAFRTVWELAFTTDAKHTVVSNMPAVRRIDAGHGRVRTQFAPTPPMSSYLLAVVVGDFDKLSARHDAVELNVIVPPGEAARAQRTMTWTQALLRWYDDYFAQPYALPKLDQIGLPAKSLAMENWGLITYPEGLLLHDAQSTSADRDYYSHAFLAHEIAHQWFGNLVTMAWWDDLWLNEAFATWMAGKATRELQPAWQTDGRRIGEREKAMAQDVLATAKPVVRSVPRDTMAVASFDAISYEKGAQVLHMVERMIGAEAWRDAMRRYMREHRFGNTVADDLWAAVVAASRKPGVREFARAWTTQPGFPLVDVAQRCDAGRGVVRVTQRRFLLREGYAPEQRWPIVLELQVGERRERIELMAPPRAPGPEGVGPASERPASGPGDAAEVRVGGCDDVVLADPGAHGYFRVRYEDALAARLASRFATLDAVDQQRLLADTWAGAQTGAVPVSRLLDLFDRLEPRTPSAVLRTAIDYGTTLHELLQGAPGQAAVRSRMLATLQSRFRAVGWDAKPGEGADERAMRGQLIGELGRLDDAEVVAEARRRFADRERQPAVLAGDVGGAVVMVVGRHADVATWETLLSMLGDRRFAGTMSWPLSQALSQPRDAEVARHAMQAALDGRLPRDLANRIFGALAREPGRAGEVWAFVQVHRQALLERSGEWARRGLYASVLSGSRDTPFAREVLAAGERDLPKDMQEETRRAVAQVERRAWAHEAVRKGLGP